MQGILQRSYEELSLGRALCSSCWLQAGSLTSVWSQGDFLEPPTALRRWRSQQGGTYRWQLYDYC